jgi:hypothetical protein
MMIVHKAPARPCRAKVATMVIDRLIDPIDPSTAH